jgi:nucleoside triphosphate pyrophosphatase
VSLSLLLASSSPRRRELLAQTGFAFESVSPRVRERSDVDLTLSELTLLNAIGKGISVARKYPVKVVLAADTLVALDGNVIGKPLDLADARKILGRLSGRVHQVCSAVFVCHLAGARSTSFREISHVRFHRLSREKIDNYLSKVNPLDKAGAYAAQGHGAEIIAGIEGSFTNVVGLPIEQTVRALREFGIAPARR